MRENSSRNQDGLKYQKLYNWGRTLIMSGVLRNMDKFPSEHMLQNKFGYSRQTVRNALDRLEQDGLIARVKGSGTYVSYAPEKNKEERPRIGLILSYFSDYLFPQVYEGIESVLREEGYEISVSVTRNRLNDEAHVSQGDAEAQCVRTHHRGDAFQFPESESAALQGDTAEKYSDAVYSQSLPE